MDFPPRGVFHPHKTATAARQYRPAAGGQSAASMARINHFGNWQSHSGGRRPRYGLAGFALFYALQDARLRISLR